LSGIVPPSVNALLVSFMLFSSLSESGDVVDAWKSFADGKPPKHNGPRDRSPSAAVTAGHAEAPLLFPNGKELSSVLSDEPYTLANRRSRIARSPRRGGRPLFKASSWS